jgi:hypothetical protein
LNGYTLNVQDWAALSSTLLGVGAAIIVGIRWTIKHYLSELKPNGGSSLKDAINRIAVDMVEVRVSLSRLEGRFDQHVEEGEK